MNDMPQPATPAMSAFDVNTYAPPIAVPAATAEDEAWQKKLLKNAARISSVYSRRAYLAEELIRAMRDKNLHRMDFIVTHPGVQRRFPKLFGGVAKVGLQDNFNNIVQNFGYYTRSLYPLLAKEGNGRIIDVAMALGFTDGISYLLDKGVSPVEDGYGRSRLVYHALDTDNAALFTRLLRDKGFQKALAEHEHAPNHLLSALIKKGDVGMLKLAVAEVPALAKANAHYERDRDVLNRTPLAYAMQVKAPPAMFDALMGIRGERDKARIAGGSLLKEAIGYDNMHAFDRLITAGAPVADTADGWSPLAAAISLQRVAMVKKLIALGGEAPYAGVAGPDLLKRALANSNGGDAGAQADIVDMIMDNFHLSRADIQEALQYTKDDGPARKRMKLRIATIDGAQDAGDGWRVLGPQQVGTISTDRSSGVEVMDIFNFATRERLIVANDARARTLLLREAFDEVKDKQVLEAASAHLPKPKPAAPKVA